MDDLIKKLEALESDLKIRFEEYNSGKRNAFNHKFGRWREKASRTISQNISSSEKSRLDKACRSAEWDVYDDDDTYAFKQAHSAYAYIESLIEDIKEDPKFYSEIADTPKQEKKNENPLVTKKNIFIVHGHDELNAKTLKQILKERFQLDSIILNEEAAKGRTIIEKLEQEAKNCSYAFVFFTSDDLVKKGEKTYYQARPNVLLEMGWCYGNLGRENTCLLYKKGTNIPSDLNGVNYIAFSDSVEEAFLKIEKELKAANLVK